MPNHDLEEVLADIWAVATWSEATEVARAAMKRMDIPVAAYRTARARKFDTFARLVCPYVSGSVLDVGAGGPDLLERLPAHTRVATDILEADRTVPGIGHIVQASPDTLPFDDGTFATVLMTGMAHHLTEEGRRRLLQEAHRCLRPGGHLVLVEETFSGSSGCGMSIEQEFRGASARFDDLDRDERFTFLSFTDWWGNRIMKGSDDIPLPMSFLDLEQWHAILGDAGLPVVHDELLGLMSGGGHLATPRGLIVGARD